MGQLKGRRWHDHRTHSSPGMTHVALIALKLSLACRKADCNPNPWHAILTYGSTSLILDIGRGETNCNTDAVTAVQGNLLSWELYSWLPAEQGMLIYNTVGCCYKRRYSMAPIVQRVWPGCAAVFWAQQWPSWCCRCIKRRLCHKQVASGAKLEWSRW